MRAGEHLQKLVWGGGGNEKEITEVAHKRWQDDVDRAARCL